MKRVTALVLLALFAFSFMLAVQIRDSNRCADLHGKYEARTMTCLAPGSVISL